MRDELGNSVTAAGAQALAAYERAVDAHLHAWPGVAPALDEALAADPDFVLAHALRALWLQTYGRSDEARAALGRAEAGAGHTSERERSHVSLVSALVGGRSPAALAQVQSFGPSNFAHLVPRLGPRLEGKAGYSLRNISYDGNSTTLQFEVRAQSFQQIEQLRSALEQSRLQARLLNSSAIADGIVARIEVKEAGA